jgi:hypothetical protein
MHIYKCTNLQNIDSDIDSSTYREALELTHLIEDLDALPAGDRTEIGERGEWAPSV